MIKLFENSWAVLIGIGKFKIKELKKYDLETPQNDVAMIKDVLTRYCGYLDDNVITLLDDQASKEDLMNVFDQIMSQKVKPNDRLLVFYSGHGITRKSPGREEKMEGYIVPYDAKKRKGELQYTSLLEFNEFVNLVHKFTKARQILFLLDCCFSGIVQKELTNQYEFDRGLCKDDMILAAKDKKAVQIFTAGMADEEVLASGSSQKFSVFTDSIRKFVTEVNPADYPEGFVSGRKLAKEVALTVNKNSILLDHRQNPRYYVVPHDELGEFVFKQFTEQEISEAVTKQFNYEPLEDIVNKSDLRYVFTRKNILLVQDIVEAALGKKYSLIQLKNKIHEVAKTDQVINTEIGKIIEAGVDFTKEEIQQYVAENIIAIGLSNEVFRPKFIMHDEATEEDVSTGENEI